MGESGGGGESGWDESGWVRAVAVRADDMRAVGDERMGRIGKMRVNDVRRASVFSPSKCLCTNVRAVLTTCVACQSLPYCAETHSAYLKMN